MKRTKNIAVVGASVADPQLAELAYAVGCEIARHEWILVCGGLGGVMEAASRGASEAGGTTIGILPGYDHSEGSRFLSIVIPTGLGHARNAVIAAAADGMIAVGGEYGTLSEIAFGLKLGKPVAALESWGMVKGVITVSSAEEAVIALKKHIA
ncbi:MAG: TIGR00725 family protein [bacterium]|nr:MAG: TIGR00725 family protein [bacterium]